MKRSITVLASIASLTAPALAEPVNAMCPIGKEPIVACAGTVEHKGRTVGLCCPGCGAAFLAWEESRKDAFLAAASAPGPATEPQRLGGLQQFGTMREVMRGGADEPRVALERFAGRAGVVGVGALAGLEGEIVILEGEVFVSRLVDGGVRTSSDATERATLLTVAKVDEWSSATVEASGVTLDELLAQELSGGEPKPFIIEADAAELSAHVINGFCPVGEDPKAHDAEPWRWSGTVSSGVTIVGFYAPGAAGALTHHGSDAHAHALIELDGQRVAAHLDAARLLGSAVLRTPAKDAGVSGGGGRTMRVDDPAELGDQLLHYPLAECLVSGQPLGSMGEPINMLVDGRLVRLCCAGCVGAIENDPDGAIEKLEAKIVEQQDASYPLETCVVSGARLGSMGEPVNVFYEGRLAKLCCAGCVDAFGADPDAAMAKVDAAYADAQRAEYPLTDCLVAGAPLGSMGEPIELVVGTRLVRFCCDGCLPAFEMDPQGYLEKLQRE